jgi:hypothetical protein
MDVDSAAQPDMSAVLEKLSTRKEMRKTGKGVIRFKGGDLDEREVILDDDYTAGLAPSDDEDEDDEEGDDDEEEDDEELDVDDLDSDEEVLEGADFEVTSASGSEEGGEKTDEEEEDSEPEPEPVSRKLKRKADPVASPGEKKKPRTHKRVSFGGKLGATGSKDLDEAKEVKSILKRKRESDAKASAGETVTTKPPVVVKAPAKAAPAVNGNANGKAKKSKGTYDFAAHF